MCQQDGYDLVVIESQDESDYIKRKEFVYNTINMYPIKANSKSHRPYHAPLTHSPLRRSIYDWFVKLCTLYTSLVIPEKVA